MVFWFPSRSTQPLTRHTTISSLDLAFLPGIELTAQSENKYISYHIESMLLILSCTFRLGYDTSIVASKVGRIMSYNFVYHIICWLVPPKSTEQVPPKREKWPLVPPNTPRIDKLLTDSAQVWNWHILCQCHLVEYAPRLFPCSSHHPQVFLSIEGRNPFYPAKKAEPRIFWILEVFLSLGGGHMPIVYQSRHFRCLNKKNGDHL